ncbi:MAG TPA: ATP-binding protein [Pseudonocardia sp.]
MDELTWSIDEADPTTLTVSGALTLRSSTALGGLMYKLLMDRGRLLVDVADVVVQWPAAVTVFPTALARTGGWPLARLALVDAHGSVASALRALGGTAEVPLAADRAGALADLARRPRRIHRSAELPGGAVAPGYARALVRAACSDWQIREDIDDRSAVVVNELVTNAVQHAGGQPVLLLTCDGRGLTIAVRDSSSRLPTRPARDSQPSTFGLLIVEELSDSWGTTPHDIGKTVWALLSSSVGDIHG